MRKLFERQLAKARRENGELDLTALANLVVSAYEEADRDRQRTDRSIALMIEELGNVHQKLVDTFEVVPEGVALFDADDRIVLWNRQYTELYATTGDAISVGSRFEDMLRAGLKCGQYTDAVGREEEWLAERLAGHRLPSSTHEQHLCGDRWVRVDERRTADGGSVGVRADITELKRREASFRLLFDENPVPMWVIDNDNQKFLAVNNAAIKHYGYGRDQFLAMTTMDVRPAADRDEFAQYIRGGDMSQGARIWRHQRSDGSHIYVSIYARSLAYRGHNARLNAIVDVTSKKRAEDQILEKERQMDAALNNMNQGLLMFDAGGRLILCNQRYLDMFNLSPEVAKPGCTLRELVDHRHQQGTFSGNPVEYCRRVFEMVAKGKTASVDIDLPDGRSIHIVNHPRSEGGWVSTHEDITERKQTQARIAKESDENRRLFETSLDLILVTDSRGNLCRISPASTAILGYSPDEMVGRCASEFMYPEDLEATRVEMREARRGRSMRNFETRYVHKQGQVVTLAWSGAWSEQEQKHFFTGRDVTERKLAEARLHYLAHYDQLTNLRNRTSLHDDLNELMGTKPGREGRAVAIVMFDLDGFKEVNDTLGHSTGDELLKVVARRVNAMVSGEARFYRLGGDEFVLLLPDWRDPTVITRFADDILKRLSQEFEVSGHQIFIGASAGIAIAPADGSTPEELISNVDLALYEAKASGRSTYRLFLPTLRAKAHARRDLDLDLRRAWLNKEFVLHFQPQLRVSDRAVVGAEALLRWRHPQQGIVGPGAFIKALSQNVVAGDVGRWVLKTACENAARWRANGLLIDRIGVNLFPAQFRSGSLMHDVDAILRETKLPPEALELEITENIALDFDEPMLETLRALRSTGVNLAFDDFGTGYASLNSLARYPLTRIKIDQSFVRPISDKSTRQDTAIVRSIIVMAHNLGLDVIAEGVETEAQAAFLWSESCDEVQGYLYAKPLPVQEFERYVRRNQELIHPRKEPLDVVA